MKEFFLKGLRIFQQIYSIKQRVAGFKLISLQAGKFGGIATVGVAIFGYLEWQDAKKALKLNNDVNEMIQIFDVIDSDHSGTIEREELKHALSKAGHKISNVQLDLLMEYADENKDGKLSRDEWLEICKQISNEAGDSSEK